MSIPINKSIDLFTINLEKTIGDAGNLVLSPIYIHTTMSCVLMGAKGDTAKEIMNVLKLNGNCHEIPKRIKKIMKDLEKENTINVANKIFVMKGPNIKIEFMEVVTTQLFCDAFSIDFSNSSNSARLINEWVEKKTNNKIKDLISPNGLDSTTRMVVVNAVYFKGLWKKPFHVNDTREEFFSMSREELKMIKMTHLKGKFLYGECSTLNAQCIELPYENSDVSMLIILPLEIEGLAEMEKNLKELDIANFRKKMKMEETYLSLPKFRIEYAISLKDALEKMRIQLAFGGMADFSDIFVSDEPLQISEVIHKALIEVSEEGVKAAAATGIISQ